LALIDTSFIRLCLQRYHGKLAIEQNSKSKFKSYYGKDWLEATENLNIGEFLYLNNQTLKIVKAPLFETKRLPTDYLEYNKPQKPIGIIERLISRLKGD